MGLRQTITQWVGIIKDALDFGPEFPAATTEHQVKFTDELTKLQHLLEQAQSAAKEKDELITKLQAAGAIRENLVVDGSAYYVKKDNALSGPFCMSCFQQNHEMSRVMPASKPKGAEGDTTNWVQCVKCRTPFRSERISEYLRPRKAVSTPAAASLEEGDEAKPVKATRKSRAQVRPTQDELPEPPKATRRRKAAQ